MRYLRIHDAVSVASAMPGYFYVPEMRERFHIQVASTNPFERDFVLNRKRPSLICTGRVW